MAKRGTEYTNSRGKRGFDLLVARSLWPILGLAKAAIKTQIDPGTSPTKTVPRVGQSGEIFEMHKLWTPGKNQAGSNILKLLEKLSIDELAQIENIVRGEMHVGSFRSLTPGDREYVLDTMSPRNKDPWNALTLSKPPGILSSYGFHYHFLKAELRDLDTHESDIRAECDLRDAANDSLKQDIGFIQTLALVGLERGFR